jgi:hypothetical protein
MAHLAVDDQQQRKGRASVFLKSIFVQRCWRLRRLVREICPWQSEDGVKLGPLRRPKRWVTTVA